MAALAFAAHAAAPAPAAPPAATEPAFSLTPARAGGSMLLHGTPGGELRGTVLVRNRSRRRVAVRLAPADIRNATNGNADYVTDELARAGRWVDLAATNVALAPGAARRVAFTVRIPRGTGGASHYAGIVAVDEAEIATAAAAKRRKGASFSFSRVNRQALPLTIRVPGALTRSVALRTTALDVQPSGASLVLGLRPGGTTLIRDARVQLRVLRGARTIVTHDSTLGQLFPGSGLEYRIPWAGRPTKGSYRVVGLIRPEGAAAVKIDETVRFTPRNVTELERKTPPDGQPPAPGLPVWVWLALAAAGSLLVGLSIAVVRLRSRAGAPTA